VLPADAAPPSTWRGRSRRDEVYLNHLRKSGIEATGKIIFGGHFPADESPGALACALREIPTPCEGRRGYAIFPIRRLTCIKEVNEESTKSVIIGTKQERADIAFEGHGWAN
jgi:hypothetical protein